MYPRNRRDFYLPQSTQVNMSSLAFSFSWEWSHFFKEQDDEKDIGTYETEVTEFKSKVRFDLRGHLEAAMASKATKMTVTGNMHIDARVIRVVDYKYQVKFNLLGQGGHLEAALASEAVKRQHAHRCQGNWVHWF